MAKQTTVVSVDFSDVKESTGINPRHQPEGDYLLKITEATVGKSKAQDTMITVLLQDVNMRSATYPYYCVLKDNQLWKLRNLFLAAGLPVPKAKGKLDVAKLKGKEVGVTLIDDEYDGKEKSVIDAVFHKDELEGESVEAEDDDFEEDEEDEVEVDDVDEDEEEEEEAPAPKKSKAKAKKAPEPEPEDDEDDEDDEEEEEEPAPVKKKAPAKKAKAKAKPAPVEDDEDEDEDDDELDLDDI